MTPQHSRRTRQDQDETVGQEPRSFSAIEGLLTKALRHHRAGRLTDAERIYRLILAIDARHADSLHLLGMIAYQVGRHETALEMIRKAIAINKIQAAYHSNLGTILQAQGRLEEAAAAYRNALALSPLLAETHYNLANVLYAQDKLEEAAACYERALALRPDLAEAHYNLGNTLQSQDKLDEAVASYECALELDPGKYEALHNLGNALQSQGQLEEALSCYERVLAVQPSYAKAHCSIGSLHHALGDLDEALVCYRLARAFEPDLAQAGFSESLAQLLQGDFAAGWQNFEWRWQTKEHNAPMRAYPQPLWIGKKLASGRVLIWREQGVGDEIMFAGLIPDVIRTGTHCVLDCDARLKPLFARSFPSVEVISGKGSGDSRADNEKLDIAAHLPIGSLPGLFRATSAAFAATSSPYLIADPLAHVRFRARYADAGRKRLVGLAWYTNNRKTGRVRSIDLSLFGPLFARSDIRLVSLQYGDHGALEKQAAAARAPLMIDRSVDQFQDIDLYAAQIAAMDMVITIDNSTAHLAGALGVPTCLLLPFVPDWRWLQTRDDSPWYPTMALFRQPRRDDWQSVVQKVATRCSQFRFRI
jgi:tetratricopeptide (TPR) repeat protein